MAYRKTNPSPQRYTISIKQIGISLVMIVLFVATYLFVSGNFWRGNASIIQYNSTTEYRNQVHLIVTSMTVKRKLETVLTYLFDSVRGDRKEAIVLPITLKNDGQRTFDPVEKNPLDPYKNATWKGTVFCGTVDNPKSHIYEGEVLPGYLSPGNSREFYAYLFPGADIEKTLKNGNVLPCTLSPLIFYPNLSSMSGFSEVYEFDLFYNKDFSGFDIRNVRQEGEKRQDSFPGGSYTGDANRVYFRLTDFRVLPRLESVFTYFFNTDRGDTRQAIVFDTEVQNIGGRYFDVTEKDPRDTWRNVRWRGEVFCGTPAYPDSNTYRGEVALTNTSSQEKRRLFSYLFNQDGLENRLRYSGETLPCTITPLVGYPNTSNMYGGADTYKFDLYYDTYHSEFGIRNYRYYSGSSNTNSSGIIDGSIIGDKATPNLPPAAYMDDVLLDLQLYRNPFTDTNYTSLSGKAAAEMFRRSVVRGVQDGIFAGDKRVNRAEAAKMLLQARYTMKEIDDIKVNITFSDVSADAWYASYVAKAAQIGVIQGYGDGTFRPNNPINTAEFVKMMTIIFDIQENIRYAYEDVDSASWYARYVGAAQKYLLFPNKTIYFKGQELLTRSDVVVALYQYFKNR